MAELEEALQAEIDRLEAVFDPAAEKLQEIVIAPAAAGISHEFFGLVWLPYRRNDQGQALPAWRPAAP
jgi:hypothetical protein